MNVNELVTMYFQSPTLSQWTKEPQIIQSLHLSQPPQLAVVYFFEADVLFQAGVLFSENIIINENPHIFLMKLPEKSSKIPKHQVRQPKQQVRHPSEKNTKYPQY